MSILIDELIRLHGKYLIEIDNKFYIQKPMIFTPLSFKLKDCYKILTDKAIAVHFKENNK